MWAPREIEISSLPLMSVCQSWNESWSADQIREFAYAHPELPRVLGIDPGQRKLALALLAPDPTHRATEPRDLRFVFMAWIGVQCAWTDTNAEGANVVLRALEPYIDVPLSYATHVVLERQHKRNGRMKALVTEIEKFIRRRVKRGNRMVIEQRDARHKFANIVGMPCPMPYDYDDRKEASCAVVDMQTRAWAGRRWHDFLAAHDDMCRDLCDAVLIAQDAVIAQRTFLLHMVRADRLAYVSQQLSARAQRNTWRRRRGGVREGLFHVQADDRRLALFAGIQIDDDDDVDESAPDRSKRRRRETTSGSDLRGTSLIQIMSRQM